MEGTIVRCVGCGVRLRLPPGVAGKRFRCPKCGHLQVAGGEPAAPRQDREALERALAAATKTTRRPLRWAFLLTIVPLAWYTFMGRGEEGADINRVKAGFTQKLAERLDAQPELKENAEELAERGPSLPLLRVWAQAFQDDEFLKALDGLATAVTRADRAELIPALALAFMQRHSGLAFLPEDTWAHWGLGALSAAAFLAYFCFAYPRGNARVTSLVKVGAFTGTIGILLLFVVQFLAGLATKVRLYGRGILMLIWLALIAIAFSYAAADDPQNGFILSFLGFTVGVGLLEELCKLLPVAWHYRQGGTLGWRGACLWGLVSGAGFAVAEGIIYASRYYNGASTADIYIVRFVSCVAMHAAWAGAAAILTSRRRDYIKGPMSLRDWLRALAPVLAVPMVLHGLYDTFLKMDMSGWALGTGVVSFGFLVWLQEREAAAERRRALALAAAS